MPTYDFECEGCHHRFEEMQSIQSKPLRRCPKCKKNRLRRLIGGGAGLIFKGSGFYATDYKSKSSGPSESEAKPEAPKEKAGEAKADAPKEKKSEAKAAPKDSGSDKSCGTSGKTGPDVRD
ncbi:MAG TPA: zinc ribbon domain-containing protein [Planctomycetota bacterium]|jgi:putative FmdB family regulatory protein|nr:zinc ribbon domain-containing protein [Planctomycetota bacterium]